MWSLKILSTILSVFQTWLEVEISQLRSAAVVGREQIGVLQISSNKSWIMATWINDKNNKNKRKETIYIMYFTISNLESAKMYKSQQIELYVNQFFWHQQFHIVISIFLSYTLYYNFYCVLPHSTFYVSLSFLLTTLESRSCSIKQFIFVLWKVDHQSVKRTSCNSWKWRARNL